MINKSAVKLFGILLVVFCGFLTTINAAPGDLDTTFAGTGFYREASNLGSADGIEATALQADGKIVSVGWVNYGDVFSCAVSQHNADGTFDTTFDGDGKTIVQIGIEFHCSDVAVQTDGKIVVVGYVRIGSVYNFAVFRYNSNGSPDTSFGGDGRKISAFINSDFAYAVAIQTDGKIVVCGNIGDEFAVARYNANGSLDASFDGDGWVATDFFGGPDHSRAIAIQTDGKIVVAGNGRTASGSTLNDFAVARYNADGSLDTSFDGDGKVLTDILGSNDNAQDVVIQADGKIVVGGSSWGTNDQFGLARYNSDGSLDTSFDGDGKVNSNITPYSELLYALAVQPDGKIVAAGVGTTFLLARYNPNGSLDSSFDGDGVASAPMPYPFSAANAVAVQADGKIVAAGYTASSSEEADFALARFNSDGSLDTSFDADGRLVSNIYSWRISANAVAIQPDGKIVAAGVRYTFITNGYSPDFAVNRYNADGTLDTSFDGDGRVTTDVQLADILHAIAIQPDGKIIVVGEGFNGLSMVRYNPNGSLDSSFGNGGLVVDGDNGSNRGKPLAVVVQPDGKILTAGQGFSFSLGYGSAIYRYNADGTRDNSFDGDGRVYIHFGNDDLLSSMALQPDGKIVVAGKAQIGSSYDFSVMRFNSNGSPDTSFDGDGVVTIDFVGGYDYVNAMSLQADGKIVVVGASSSDNNLQSLNYDSALARLNTNGSLDTSFDGDGKIRVSLSNYFDTATGVAIQTDGKILTAGYTASLLNNDLGTLDNNFALVRYNSNGSFDNTYGINGKAVIDLFIHDLANDMALDSSGRAVVVGETDGYFTVARFLGGAASPNIVAPFDFDGDGKSDISVFRPSNGQWWLNRSSAGVAAVQFGSSSDKLTPGDFTGDGKTDIAFWRASTGEWFVLRSEDGSFFSHPFGTSGDIPAPGDYDLDGKTDEAVFRPSTATWYILRSSGGTTIQQFGQSGDVPVVSDYDGDGRADIAIYRVSLGEWWINRSTAGLIAFQFGNSTDKPVQGDYTGDGKADVALFRPSTGEWFVLRSENQSYYSFPFGTNGDTPAPGDYDGDGKMDATVFRSSNTTWYSNRTTAGILIQQFGQAGDTPVPSAFVP
jgi:uncharacterized delta-60 repeat protein